MTMGTVCHPEPVEGSTYSAQEDGFYVFVCKSLTQRSQSTQRKTEAFIYKFLCDSLPVRLPDGRSLRTLRYNQTVRITIRIFRKASQDNAPRKSYTSTGSFFDRFSMTMARFVTLSLSKGQYTQPRKTDSTFLSVKD